MAGAATAASGSSASPFASLRRRLQLVRCLFSSVPLGQGLRPFSIRSFCTANESDLEDGAPGEETEVAPQRPQQQRLSFQRPLENGLDQGVFKAILLGKVGQKPVQKWLKSGRQVTLFSLGTGGIRNNRRPLDDEDPREYADRCSVQWHRVAVYPERLGNVAMKHAKPGAVIYIEGNLESKVFSDPITGLVKRIREISIRRDGRLVFLGSQNDDKESAEAELKGVGYY